MKRAVCFDMNETLINLNLLEDKFREHFKDPYAMKYWFSKLLHSSTVIGMMGAYTDFGILANFALENLFYENEMKLSESTKSEILSSFENLPAYDDVKLAVRLLKENSFAVIAVSNSSFDMIKTQLTKAGIVDMFDSYYSVEVVAAYKPIKDVYHFVAEKENFDLSKSFMVATHDWDLYGAKKAGMKTAYIERGRELFHKNYPNPDLRSSSLQDLAQQIINY
ncbi:MAG: haloacid dehalogenase type II [Nonlabens sp.]